MLGESVMLDAGKLRDEMLSAMSSNPDNREDAFLALATAIAGHIKDNLEIDVPAGKVIGSVTGGSGTPAIGIVNPAKISCTVK